MKILLVSGAHHEVPNALTYAYLKTADADAKALEMVNLIRGDAPRDGMDSDEATPALDPLPAGADWRAGLLEAQRCIVSFHKKIPLAGPHRVTSDPWTLVRAADCNVEIVELDVDIGTFPLVQELRDAVLEPAVLLRERITKADHKEREAIEHAFRALDELQVHVGTLMQPFGGGRMLQESELLAKMGFSLVSLDVAMKAASERGFSELHSESENGDMGDGSRRYYRRPGGPLNQHGFPLEFAQLDRWGPDAWTLSVQEPPGSACDDPVLIHALDNARYPDDRPAHDFGQGSHEQSFGGEGGE